MSYNKEAGFLVRLIMCMDNVRTNYNCTYIIYKLSIFILAIKLLIVFCKLQNSAQTDKSKQSSLSNPSKN